MSQWASVTSKQPTHSLRDFATPSRRGDSSLLVACRSPNISTALEERTVTPLFSDILHFALFVEFRRSVEYFRSSPVMDTRSVHLASSGRGSVIGARY